MFEELTKERIKTLLLSRADFHPYPRIEERAAWETLPAAAKEAVRKNAARYEDYELTVLTASLYMDYFRTGQRKAYEDPFFERRNALSCLTLAECLEDQGRYMGKITDLIWAICEESTWSGPSHNYVYPDNDDVHVGCLPDPGQQIFDIFAGDTASLIAFVLYLLRTRLEAVSPLLVKRMEHELHRRIVDPYLESDGYFWMMLRDLGSIYVNNWMPWCTSNALAALLLTEDDCDRRAVGVSKALGTLDRFIATYPEDGGCNEGPGYWYKASGCVYDSLALVELATGCAWNPFSGKDKLRRMAEYIADVHIYGTHFVSFADGDERCGFLPQKLYLFAKAVKSEKLENLAIELFQDAKGGLEPQGNPISGVQGIFAYDALDGRQPKPERGGDVYLKDLSIACFREENGFFVSVKGGNNDESHNHTDVGNFVVYYKNSPVLVDMGSGNYTSQHWGDTRYTVMSERTAYHNLPVFGGVEQAPGRQFAARGMRCSAEGNASAAVMDIAAAYPPEAALVRWERKVTLHRGELVSIEETGAAAKAVRAEYHFITPWRPQLRGTKIVLGNAQLYYDGAEAEFSFEKLELDGRLAGVWGKLYRITIAEREAREEFSHTFTIMGGEA